MNGIKRSHHRQQHLGGADIAGGFISPDVLLTGLQGQTQGDIAFAIF